MDQIKIKCKDNILIFRMLPKETQVYHKPHKS